MTIGIGSSKQFWSLKGTVIGRGGDVDGGSGGAWAAFPNTLAVLTLIFIWQLATKTKICLSLGFISTRADTNDDRNNSSSCPVRLKNSVAASSSSADSQTRISEIISYSDLKCLVDDLDEKSYEDGKWLEVIDRRNSLLSYRAKYCKPKDGPLKYLSLTILESCSPEMLKDFYMNNAYRKQWDKTFIDHEQLQVDESGTEICRMIKKFPLLTPREYILAWRVWKTGDGTFYCLTKECGHPLAPRQKKYVRVKFFRSGWRIRKVPGRNASEIKMVHQEDAGLNTKMAKLAFAKGIWAYVCRMDHAFREYSASSCQPSLTETSTPLIEVSAGLYATGSTSGPAPAEIPATSARCSQIAYGGGGRKFLRCGSTNKSIANGLILLGGVLCVSRCQSSLATKVAMACIWSKLTKVGASLNLRRQAQS